VREATEAASEGTYKLRLLLHHDGRVSTTLTPLAEEASGRRWLMLSPERVSSESVFQYHKTTMRGHYERAFQEASAAGAYDVLFLNERNEIAETARHNLFLEKGGELLTPPLSAGILNGIQRGLILGDPARKAREASLTLEDLVRADRIFLTNSVRGMVEVELLPAQRDSLLREGKLACSA
jgi:para-aminobenzoate synthetase/4-amino-4-deoxychorismate lyase